MNIKLNLITACLLITSLTLAAFDQGHGTGQSKQTPAQAEDKAQKFDAEMKELLVQGVGGNSRSLQEMIDRCNQQLASGELPNLAKVWKGTAIVLQSSALFQAGNWEDGLEKWNAGLALVEEADVEDASPLTKRQVASTCLGTWSFEQDKDRKHQIAKRGLAALATVHIPDSKFWKRQPADSRKKWLSDAVAAAHEVGEEETAKALLKSLTELAPNSDEVKKAHDLLSGKRNPENKDLAQRFDELVREDFFEGIFNADEEAFARAMKLCTDTLEKDANHYEAMVWLGSGRLHESDLLEKDGKAEASKQKWHEGLKLMHRACASAPDDVNVLIPRAATLIGIGRVVPMPEAERLALVNLAVYDYERTFELQKGYFKNLSSHARGELLFGLGDGWHQLNNKEKANNYFRQVIETVPEGEQAKLSKMFLNGKIDKEVLANRNCAGCH